MDGSCGQTKTIVCLLFSPLSCLVLRLLPTYGSILLPSFPLSVFLHWVSFLSLLSHMLIFCIGIKAMDMSPDASQLATISNGHHQIVSIWNWVEQQSRPVTSSEVPGMWSLFHPHPFSPSPPFPIQHVCPLFLGTSSRMPNPSCM